MLRTNGVNPTTIETEFGLSRSTVWQLLRETHPAGAGPSDGEPSVANV